MYLLFCKSQIWSWSIISAPSFWRNDHQFSLSIFNKLQIKGKLMRIFAKLSIICILGLAVLAPNMAFSHSDHGEPLNDKQAIIVASKYLEVMVEKSEANKDGKLNLSWTRAVDREIFKKGLQYFIVSFKNDEEQKSLYILLNVYGEYLAANFHGSFKNL